MTRVLSALVLLPVVFGIIWYLPPVWTLLFAELVLFRALIEFAEIAARTEAPFSRPPTVAAAAVVCAALTVAPAGFPAVLMAGSVGIAVVELAFGRARSLASVSAAGFTLLYLAIPIGCLVALRSEGGPQALTLCLITIMASDTAQYYGGRTFGRRALAPAVSPHKTVEGALFGFGAGMVVLVLAGRWWLPEIDPVSRALLGATLAGLGIAGDLFESRLKRAAHVKDASAIIPGHGGVLDRIDGILFAAPVYYAVFRLAG